MTRFQLALVFCLSLSLGATVLGQAPALGAAQLAEQQACSSVLLELDRHLAVVEGDTFRLETACEVMNRLGRKIGALPVERLAPAQLGRVVQRLESVTFALQSALDERTFELHAAGAYSEDLANAKRRALRGVRSLRERAQARAIFPEGSASSEGFALTSASPDVRWTVRPERRNTPLKHWPRTFVVVSDPGAVESAAVACALEEDSVFGHLALAYRSDESHRIRGTSYPSGTLFVIEAHLKGVAVLPRLSLRGDRHAVFFLRDLTSQAALDQAAEDFLVRAAQGKRLGYDYSMGSRKVNGLAEQLGTEVEPSQLRLSASDYESATEFFCSEVGEAVFTAAGLNLFPHQSRLNTGAGSRDVFARWGVDSTLPVSAPGDVDVSPALVRVAEGARVRTLRANHRRHAALATVFDELDLRGQRLRSPWHTRLFTRVASSLSGIPRAVMGSMLPLRKLAKSLTHRLAAKELHYHEATGHGMSPTEQRMFLKSAVKSGDVDLRRWLRPAE